jgi:hypothetical protein
MLAFFALALAGSGAAQAPKSKPTAPQAIASALAWLARHQNPDGSWGGKSLIERCQAGSRCYDKSADATGHYDEGLTGLAVLAFLRAGTLNASAKELVDPATGTALDPASVVRTGLTWLKKTQKKSGTFGREMPFLYNDAIGTLAMAEAFRITKVTDWKDSASKGVDYLQRAQRTSPTTDKAWGWRYYGRQEIEQRRPRNGGDEQQEAWKKELHDSDVSATGWAVAALVAADEAGIETKSESLSGALDFLNYATKENGLVGYLAAETAGAKVSGPFDSYRYHVATMSSIGVLIRSTVGRDWKNPFFDIAAREILRDMPPSANDKLSVDFYYWYHGTLALNRMEGTESAKNAKRKVAAPWNKAVVDALLALQDRTKGSCSLGGWVVPDRWNLYAGGPVYETTLGVLTLAALTPP